MLHIKNVDVEIEGKKIIQGLNLDVKEGEVHVIMGPNGIGKSSLLHMLIGHPSYQVVNGTVTFRGKDLLTMSVDERAREGLFVGFQHPVDIAGMKTKDFLYKAYLQKNVVSRSEFEKICQKYAAFLNIPDSFFSRDFNQGFSGGEKKRNELLQLLLLQPKLALLDEIDSGLDVDAILQIPKILEQKDPKQSFIFITHYEQLIEKISLDYVHLMQEGRIVRSGQKELAQEIFNQGYQKKNDA